MACTSKFDRNYVILDLVRNIDRSWIFKLIVVQFHENPRFFRADPSHNRPFISENVIFEMKMAILGLKHFRISLLMAN